MSLIAETHQGGYSPRVAAGIVFYARMLGGLRVEHVGIPFEHRGRTFAIHRSTVFLKDSIKSRGSYSGDPNDAAEAIEPFIAAVFEAAHLTRNLRG